MTNAQDRALPLGLRFLALGLIVGAASFAASTAYTREDGHAVRYACSDGERFSVEYLPGHVRLRTGAGVFALTGDTAAQGPRYTDGRTAFWTDGEHAMLERPGLAAPVGCKAQQDAL